MIKVVNKGTKRTEAVRIYVGRPSPLGNPFTHIADRRTLAQYVVSSRDEAIEAYEGWLTQHQLDEPVAAAMNNLRRLHAKGIDLELECWCVPLRCHGEVLKQWIEAAQLVKEHAE